MAKTHQDEFGVMHPFFLAPVQIAFVLVNPDNEIEGFQKKINSVLSHKYRTKLYNHHKQVNVNLLQADKEGCPIKIVLGKRELEKKEITLINRCELKIKKGIELSKEKQLFLKEIREEIKKYQFFLFQQSKQFLKKNIFFVNDVCELTEKIKGLRGGLFCFFFCDIVVCEENIRSLIAGYSVRCIKQIKKRSGECIFCKQKTNIKAFLGRAY